MSNSRVQELVDDFLDCLRTYPSYTDPEFDQKFRIEIYRLATLCHAEGVSTGIETMQTACRAIRPWEEDYSGS